MHGMIQVYPVNLFPVRLYDFSEQLDDLTLISLLHDTKCGAGFETVSLRGRALKCLYPTLLFIALKHNIFYRSDPTDNKTKRSFVFEHWNGQL